jgi:hypothetical protein
LSVSNEISSRAFMVSRIAGVKCLVPSDLFSEEFMAPMREGREVLLSARKPRSVRQLRFLFALLRVVVRNSEKWADEHVLLDDLKLATGLFETRVSAITGMPYPVPASISFAAMPPERFNLWIERALDVLARDVLRTYPAALRAAVEDMIAPAGGAA